MVFWPRSKELTHRHGALLVFDEVVTAGFRLHIGGAQSLFGVIPDLSAFGKGLANGYPVSAVVGRAEVMREMEEVFFSFTFGGETLSLAAALATLHKLQNQPVIDQLRRTGESVVSMVTGLVAQFGLEVCCSVSGHPAWSFLSLRDVGDVGMWGLKTLLLQEMFAHGVLTLGTHNISYAHADEDLKRLRRGYERPLRACAKQSTAARCVNCCDANRSSRCSVFVERTFFASMPRDNLASLKIEEPQL